jgi:DNA repair protein RadC
VAGRNHIRNKFISTSFHITTRHVVNFRRCSPIVPTARPGHLSRASSPSDENIIAQAFTILSNRLHSVTVKLSSPDEVRQFLVHKLMLEEREVFGAIWLTLTNRVIACEELSWGTLGSSRIYPREVIKSALKHNAGSVIFFHNHPSGEPKPSMADRTLTERLAVILESVEIEIIDHFIVAGTQTFSFAEHGEL